MADEDTELAQQSQWERWTDDSGPFYRSCAVWPVDSGSESTPPGDHDRPAVQFTTGITRRLLRHLPTFLGVSMILYFGITLARGVGTGTVQRMLPQLTLRSGAVLVGAIGVGLVWAYLVYRLVASGIRGSGMYRGVVFFTTALPLMAGTAYAVHKAVTVAGSGADPALGVQAGYFLFVLVAGHLVYDGLALKTENLFTQLKNSSIVSQPAYDEFYTELTTV